MAPLFTFRMTNPLFFIFSTISSTRWMASGLMMASVRSTVTAGGSGKSGTSSILFRLLCRGCQVTWQRSRRVTSSRARSVYYSVKSCSFPRDRILGVLPVRARILLRIISNSPTTRHCSTCNSFSLSCFSTLSFLLARRSTGKAKPYRWTQRPTTKVKDKKTRINVIFCFFPPCPAKLILEILKFSARLSHLVVRWVV